MKVNQIYVSSTGTPLQMTTGHGVAIRPPQKGEKKSHVLLSDGRLAVINGARINGVGVPRFLESQGFCLAEPGNKDAEALADHLDMIEGLKFVEQSCVDHVAKLSEQFDGQAGTFIPFDEDKAPVDFIVEATKGYVTQVYDLSSGFGSAGLGIKFDTATGWGSTLALNCGWIALPAKDPSLFPRNTEYGGLVERAVYVICNSGLGTLVGAQHLVMDEAASEAELFARGKLEVLLTTGDRLIVGIDAMDQLVVQYLRGNEVLYARTGMSKPRLGEVIGAIAAVIVRVGEMDAAPAKKPRKKAA